MIDIAQIEKQLYTHLSQMTSACHVDMYQGALENYDYIASGVSLVIHFQRVIYTNIENIVGSSGQEMQCNFVCMVVGRKRSGPESVLAMLSQVRCALLGWQPMNELGRIVFLFEEEKYNEHNFYAFHLGFSMCFPLVSAY